MRESNDSWVCYWTRKWCPEMGMGELRGLVCMHVLSCVLMVIFSFCPYTWCFHFRGFHRTAETVSVVFMVLFHTFTLFTGLVFLKFVSYIFVILVVSSSRPLNSHKLILNS